MSAVAHYPERDTPLFHPLLDAVSDIDNVNALLRGELAAVESYDQALAKFPDELGIGQLRMIRREHFKAANDLRDLIKGHGGQPAQSSGAWGAFAAAVTGTAKVFGWSAAISALEQGEERGISDYQSAIESDAIPSDCRAVIRGELLPMCEQHVAELNNVQALTKE